VENRRCCEKSLNVSLYLESRKGMALGRVRLHAPCCSVDGSQAMRSTAKLGWTLGSVCSGRFNGGFSLRGLAARILERALHVQSGLMVFA